VEANVVTGKEAKELYVIAEKCEERHKGQTALIQSMNDHNLKEHEGIKDELKNTVVAVGELATATNGKMAKLHDRVDDLVKATDASKLELVTLITEKTSKIDGVINTIQHKFNHWIIGLLLSIIGTLIIACATIFWQGYNKSKDTEVLRKLNENVAMISIETAAMDNSNRPIGLKELIEKIDSMVKRQRVIEEELKKQKGK